MDPLIRLKHRSIRMVKGLLKQAMPRSWWLRIKNSAGGLVPSKEEYATLMIKKWAEARRTPNTSSLPKLENGITLVGYLSTANGLGEAARSSLRAIQAAGIPYSLVDLDYDVPKRQRITHPDPNAPTGFRHQVNLLHANPNHLAYIWEKYGPTGLLGRYTIGVWYWELPTIPTNWLPAFQVLDEIWAPTHFIMNAIQACSSIPVQIVPPCIQVRYDKSLNRADFNLPENSFLFLCAYDILSVQARKNPEGAIEAFRRAFPTDDQSVGLVIKINNAEENPDGVARLEKSLHGYRNIFFVKSILPRDHFNALIHLSDAYVSLHRSEGFGLVAAEAIYLGKPVIMTNWSGNTDYMTPENSSSVDFKLVPVGEGCPPYAPDQLWADPDIDHAASLMKETVRKAVSSIANEDEPYEKLGIKYSPQAVGDLMKNLLSDLPISPFPGQ